MDTVTIYKHRYIYTSSNLYLYIYTHTLTHTHPHLAERRRPCVGELAPALGHSDKTFASFLIINVHLSAKIPAHVVQRVAVCCSVLQCVAVCCSVLPRVTVIHYYCPPRCQSCFSCSAVRCGVLQSVAVCCSVLQRVAMCCSVLRLYIINVHLDTKVPAHVL